MKSRISSIGWISLFQVRSYQTDLPGPFSSRKERIHSDNHQLPPRNPSSGKSWYNQSAEVDGDSNPSVTSRTVNIVQQIGWREKSATLWGPSFWGKGKTPSRIQDRSGIGLRCGFQFIATDLSGFVTMYMKKFFGKLLLRIGWIHPSLLATRHGRHVRIKVDKPCLTIRTCFE